MYLHMNLCNITEADTSYCTQQKAGMYETAVQKEQKFENQHVREKSKRGSTTNITGMPFKKFSLQNIQSMKQTEADQTISSSHTNAYLSEGRTHQTTRQTN